MKLYSENEYYRLYQGSCLDMLEDILPNSVDSIVTDPPYGLTSITKRFGKEDSAPAQYGKDGSFARLSKGFMGKEWDGSGIEYNIDTWRKCYEVLKPGGYLLAFGGTRTFHRIACAIEDAGFEIRDTIMWLYGSGFPKSMNVGLALDKKNGVESIDTGIVSPNARPNCDKSNTLYESGTVGKEFTIKKANNEWDGWGTSLKPAYEPIIVARKPFKGSLVDNVEEYGVGAVNIDECRVPFNGDMWAAQKSGVSSRAYQSDEATTAGGVCEANEKGRFPANVILTYGDEDFDEVCGGMPNTSPARKHDGDGGRLDTREMGWGFRRMPCEIEDSGGSAARYFYCAKASKQDRDEGLEEFEEKTKVFNGKSDKSSEDIKDVEARFTTRMKNTHPTVKPQNLMRYLVRLVTPKDGTVLDLFNGSGSTGKAVMLENKQFDKNYRYIGIDLEEEYLKISKARIEYICNNEFTFDEENNHQVVNKDAKGSKKESEYIQGTIFDLF